MRLLRMPHIERGDAPELVQMGERLTRWRLAYPALWRKFWSVRGARCIVCGRTTPDFIKRLPDGTGEVHLACFPAPGSRAHTALNAGGVDAVYHQPIEDGEVWCAWCPTCPSPTTAADIELMAAPVQRRAGLAT